MKDRQTVVFAGVENEDARRAAEAFAQKPGCVVYVLHGVKERTVQNPAFHVIEVAERGQEELTKAMKCIEEEQGSIDMLVLSIARHCSEDGRITDGHDYEELFQVLDENVIGTLETVKAALELMRKGTGKRLALLTEKNSSINLNKEMQDYGYWMSLSALNMMERILFNTLRTEGFTFRCYAAGEESGMSPEIYFQSNLSYDGNDASIHSDENRIVMRDGLLCEFPW